MNRHIVDSSWGFGLVFLLLRVPSLLVVLGWWCPSEALQYLQSPLRHSIFSDAWSVLPTLHQATAIRRLVRPHQWVNVYQGGDIGVPRPLFLVAVESTSALQLWWWCFRALVDLLLVRLLKTLAERSEERQDVREDILLTNMKKKILPRMAERPHIDSALMAAAYAFSPIVAFDASCQNLSLLCLLWAFDAASPIWTGVALAVSTYLETPTVVFLIPSVLWRRDARLLIPFAMTILFLYTLSYALTGDSVFWELWNKPPTIHEPSLSVQWYLQMELFDRFRLYFGWLIPGLPYLLVAPLSIRLWRYPMALTAILWSLWALFRPAHNLWHWNVALLWMLFEPLSLQRMNTNLVLGSMFALGISLSLYVPLYGMWLDTGVGEPNFLFFQCLALNMLVGLILVDFVSATLQRDKALRVTEKQLEMKVQPTEDG